MFRQICSFLELIRFSHTLFALPFALTGAVLAWKHAGFQWVQLAGILLSMVFARSAAMAFNRLTDRRFDAANPAAAGRHLPAGRLTPAAVWLFTLFCTAGFVASTLLFLWATPPNPWPLYLSVPVLVFVGAYSLTKHFTALSHFWLGRLADAGTRGGVDRHPRRRRLDHPGDAVAPRRRRPLLGGWLRHPLRLPGRRFRPQGTAA